MVTNVVRRSRGISLIEAVLYLLISLSVVTGGIVFFQQASQESRMRDATQSILGLQSSARAIAVHDAVYGPGNLTPAIIIADAFPTRLTPAEDLSFLVNEFGGQTSVTGYGRDRFSVDYSGIPVDACTRLLPFQATGQGVAGTDISGVQLSGDGGDFDFWRSDGGVLPDEAAEACAEASDGGLLAVAFLYSPASEDDDAGPGPLPGEDRYLINELRNWEFLDCPPHHSGAIQREVVQQWWSDGTTSSSFGPWMDFCGEVH